MNRHALIAVAVLALCAPAAAATSPVWTPDLVHSRAQFMVSHLVVSKVWGHIPIRQMTLDTKSGSIIPTQLDAMLDVSHEDTDNHDRDSDLRSATYFDVAQYPSITFRSTKIEPKDADNFSVTGDLTIKNVTKPVTFPVHVEGVVPDEKGGMRVGYTAELHIDRRDWGLVDSHLTAAGVLLVGYDVMIGLTAEAVTNDPSIKASKPK
jgi:polyisoprenoid-binding protein YceI